MPERIMKGSRQGGQGYAGRESRRMAVPDGVSSKGSRPLYGYVPVDKDKDFKVAALGCLKW
jgi:hypothetical protein